MIHVGMRDEHVQPRDVTQPLVAGERGRECAQAAPGVEHEDVGRARGVVRTRHGLALIAQVREVPAVRRDPFLAIGGLAIGFLLGYSRFAGIS